MFKINDVSGQCGEAVHHAEQFLPYAHKKLGFNKPVGVNFVSDPENAKNPLGKTAYYDPNKMQISVFVDKRHVKDILRSLSHELVHHAQCCRGEFDKEFDTEAGYAQKDPHMRKMEAEAYLLGNGFLFRDWEDSLREKKGKITMAENKNIKEGGPRGPFGSGSSALFKPLADLLQKMREQGQNEQSILDYVKDLLTPAKDHEDAEAANKLARDPNQMEEAIMSGEETTEPEGRFGGSGVGTKPDGEDTEPVMNEEDESPGTSRTQGGPESVSKPGDMPQTVSFKDVPAHLKEKWKKKGLTEKSTLKVPAEDKAAALKKLSLVLGRMKDKTNENWKKGNKDQLLFERLMEKWVK
tara:strand:+ start:1684 stop:2742 length:1059 start_codon:yes stop_codon:yes gene_type:complete